MGHGRIGKRLGWQVYTQELLEFHCANEVARQSVLADVPGDAAAVAVGADRVAQALQAERSLAAARIAEKYRAYVVLKGHRSMVCSPDGSQYVNKSGNAGLAGAGSGDVLSGIIGSLLAQGIAAEEAVRGADIVVTATFAKDPVIEDSWIEAGTRGVHINAMGSNRANRREIPSDLVARANVIACDSIDQAKIEAGDLIMAPVDWNDSRIVELSTIEKRPAGNPLTIFESLGLGVEDVVAAAWVYEKLR